MAYNTLLNSTTADASDVNDNFQHIAAGSRLPMSSVGVSFATTDSAYDLGADATRWNDLYCDNVNFAGSVTTADKTLWTLEAETTLADTATSISFTGLDGDTDINYMILVRLVSSNSQSTLLTMYFNEDSSASYGRQYIVGQSTAVSSSRATGQQGFNVARSTLQTATVHSSFSKTIIYAKSGHERTMLSNYLDGASGSFIYKLYSSAGIYSNTSNNITSIQLNKSSGGLMTNTTAQLWKRG